MAESVYSKISAKNKIYEAERKQKVELNAQLREQQRLKEERENASIWEKIGATTADIFTEIGGGLLKGIEGIVDAAVSVAGWAGGLFGADTKWAEDIVKFDATNEWYYETFENDLTKYSALNDAPIVKDILGGVGQMLPTIALSTIGLGWVGVAGTVAGAGGTGVEESLNEGANFNQAFAYGVTQAGIEGVIETATAGMGKGITAIGKAGKTAGKTFGKTVAKSVGKRMFEEGVSEAVEEGLSAIVNPLTKSIYQGKDALEAYNDLTFYLDAGKQALVGGVVGGISAGSSGAIVQRRVGGRTNYSISQSYNEIESLDRKENNLWKNGKLNEKEIAQIDKQREIELENISQKLQTLDTETKKSTIRKFGLGNYFNENGELLTSIDQNEFNLNNSLIRVSETSNIEAYSPNVRKSNLLFAPTSHALSNNSIEAKSFITTMNPNAKLVISDTMPKNVDAFYDTKNKIFYFSNTATKETLAGHEFTHSLEGTKAYKAVADFILASTENLDEKIKQKIDQYSEVNREFKQGEEGAKVALYEAQTEIVAEEMGRLLRDPKSVQRIVNQNKSAAYRIMQWIKDALVKLTKRGKNGEYYNFLRNAEKLYAQAVRESTGGVSLSEVAAYELIKKLAEQETGEKSLEIDQEMVYNTNDVRYSLKEIKLSKSEYAVLRKTIFEKNATRNIEQHSVDYAFTANNFYVYENYGEDNFKIVKKLNIEKYYEKINQILEVFKSAKTITSAEDSNTILETLRAGRRSRGRDNSNARRGVSDNRDGRLSSRESESDTKRDSSKSGGDKRELIKINTAWGKGYDIRNINIDEYNLIRFKNDSSLKSFNDLLGEVESIIENEEVKNTTKIRLELFEILSKQEQGVYSKLVEINNALQKTIEDYSQNKSINIRESFIKNLGYNGIVVKSGDSSFDSVIYDVNNKKKNLLDFSPKRAAERLDKAIKLFGETKNPEKAGWLLSDGRFVDYNRDSQNILKETSEDFVLDYRDHFQIEDVYDTKRGYDAIDSFMAEGNIRLMPEAGGIELRNKPTVQQVYALKKYIDSIIDKNGITLDLRKPNTTDNVLPNYVYYDSQFSANTIINDINSFYNNGEVSRVVDGVRYSLKEDGSKILQNVSEKDIPIKLQDAIINYLEEIDNGKRRNDSSYQNEGREANLSSSERIRAISQEHELNQNIEAINFVCQVIKSSELFKVYNTKDLLKDNRGFDEEIKIIDDKSLPKQLNEIRKENSSLGIKTFYYLADEGSLNYDTTGFFELFGEEKRLFILFDPSNPDFVKTNRHERAHYLQNYFGEKFEAFVNDINSTLTIKEKNSIYDKYYEQYSQVYKDVPIDQIEDFIWNEVYAQLYAMDESIENKKGLKNAVEKLESEVKIKYGLDDIRYSLKDGEGNYNYSKGQIAKYIAEHSRVKAYLRTDAEQIINTIVSNQLSYGSKYGDLTGKTKQQVIDTLWHSLNTKPEGFRAEAALDVADFIIKNAVMEDIYQESNNDYEKFVVGQLRDYLHSVDLAGIKEEIKSKFDKDNSVYLLWGKRRGTKGQSPDQIKQELQSRGINLEAANEADIFFEMDALYRESVKKLKKDAKERLADTFTDSEINDLKQSIAREVLNSFDVTGHKTKFAETIEKYTSKISELKRVIRDIKAYNKAKNSVISSIERLRDEFVKNKPAGWKVPQQVADFVKKIARVETWRNNISKTAREHLLELNNQIDLVMDETQQQIYPFRETLRELGSGKGELTTQELQTLDTILRQFAWQLRNYNKVNFENATQDVDNIAAQGVHESKQAKTILRSGSNVLIKFKNKVYTNPYDRLAEIGLYRENSIAMRLYRDMLQGDRNRAKLLYEANQSFNSFFDKNKGYLKELQKTITLGDVTLTKRQALALYCTSLRDQGRVHLFNQGYNSGVVRILDNKYSTQGKTLEAFAKGKDITITSDMIAQIKDSLTEVDKAYLDVVDNFFNKISKNAKKETDQKLYGITNIEEGYYFPLKVSSDKIYTEAGQNNLNVNQYILDLGMNKSTKPHANNKIVIDGIDNIISNHLQSLSLYYGYAVPLTAYNRIMNRQIMEFEGADSTSNMRGEIQKIDVDFEGYMNRLWQDVQGIRRSDKGYVSRLLSKIRWAGANSALGANPKVLFTQTLSLAAGISEFNPKYVAKGMGHFFGEKQKLELAKYSSLMWERMQIGNSVDIAEIRQIGKEIGAAGKITSRATKFLNDFTTKPISWMDSNVIQSLWFAAQYEVADTKGKGFEFGTEANKVEAGKRLDEVVFRTQQTSDPLGRSEWMRSQNEIVKFARMFTGDALQLTGRLISSVNKYNIAKKMIKSGDTGLVEQGQKMLSSAKKGVAKASSAFILNQTMLLAIAMAFKWIKGKDDDEEWSEIAKNEAIANIMGLIPFGGDIYDKLLGYEPTNMAYTALSNTVEIGQELYDGISSLISGDYQDPVKRNAAIRKTALSMSRLLGIPAQNLESYIKGVVGHVSPGTREEYEALFKTKSNVQYLKKIQQATEDGNEELADTIINIMFDSRTGKIKDDKVLAEKRALIELGYNVIPKSVGNSITYDGVEYTLSSRQHSQFMKIYSQATEKVKNMVNTSSYEKLEDGAKAKAMNFIYNYYYNLAIEDLLGEDLEMKTILFAEAIPVEQLAMAIAQAQLYTADTDKEGKSISGTKKAKVQSFIQGLKLTATQKYMLM